MFRSQPSCLEEVKASAHLALELLSFCLSDCGLEGGVILVVVVVGGGGGGGGGGGEVIVMIKMKQ